MIIDLIRHTTPDVSKGVCYGQTDLSLIEDHQSEFQAVKERALAEYDLIVSSPLQRCSKLANTLISTRLEHDSRVKEYNFGDWEMRPWAELTSNEAKKWMANFIEHPAPNGESMLNMQTRVLNFWSELISKNHKTVAVVTHSGVQRLLHAHILSTPLKMMFRLELKYGAMIRVTHSASDKLTTLRHL